MMKSQGAHPIRFYVSVAVSVSVPVSVCVCRDVHMCSYTLLARGIKMNGASKSGEAGGSSEMLFIRVKQIVEWCGADYDGVIAFDEAHKAKNMSMKASNKRECFSWFYLFVFWDIGAFGAFVFCFGFFLFAFVSW